MIKCYIFDLDGTLLNTLSTICHYVNRSLQKLGAEPISEQECRDYIGSGARNLLTLATKARGVYSECSIDRVLESYLADYDSSPNKFVHPYDGIVELLSALKAKGARLAVLSNKPESSVILTVREFFGDSFDAVKGGRKGIPLKPDPTTALELSGELGVDPSECAFIGDSDTDILTGKRFGAGLTVGVDWGYRSREVLEKEAPDLIVSHPSEILGREEKL